MDFFICRALGKVDALETDDEIELTIELDETELDEDELVNDELLAIDELEETIELDETADEALDELTTELIDENELDFEELPDDVIDEILLEDKVEFKLLCKLDDKLDEFFDDIFEETDETKELDESLELAGTLEKEIAELIVELRLAADEVITTAEDACEDSDDLLLDNVIWELADEEYSDDAIDWLLELVTPIVDDCVCPSSPPLAPQAPKLNKLIINSELIA